MRRKPVNDGLSRLEAALCACEYPPERQKPIARLLRAEFRFAGAIVDHSTFFRGASSVLFLMHFVETVSTEAKRTNNIV